MMTEKAARIAELEREIEAFEAVDGLSILSEQAQANVTYILARLRDELTRTRNETPAITQGEGSEPVGWRRRWKDPSTGKWGKWDYSLVESPPCKGPYKGENIEVEALYASPPPLPAGNADPRVREAFDQAARVAEEWDSGWGEDRNTKVARQTAIEIAGAIRALPSPQSQGLVEAAEHADQEEIIFQALKKSPLDCRTERTQRLLAAEIHEALRSRASDRSA